MSTNPLDYLNSVHYSVDPLRIEATVSAGLTLAKTDPLNGIGSIISTSTALHSLINPTSHLFGQHALTTLDTASALSSLSVLRSPYDALKSLDITFPTTRGYTAPLNAPRFAPAAASQPAVVPHRVQDFASKGGVV